VPQSDAGIECRDVRTREIRGLSIDPDSLVLTELRYETAIGTEVFLQFVTPDDRLAAFLRLSLPEVEAVDAELRGRALIREVHVYGGAVGLGRRTPDRAQHLGLGRRLIERAGERAAADGFEAMAVISAVGTRAYYRNLGFRDGELYQHRSCRDPSLKRCGT
jgi:elongator complex protein 3